MAFGYPLITLLLIFQIANACFITNCPVGGGKKGSGSTNLGFLNSSFQYKQCSSCGPNNTGRCFGPRLCCSSEFGCFVYSNDIAKNPCQTEAYDPVPCQNNVKSCSSVLKNGQCVFDNYCCNSSGTCRFVEEELICSVSDDKKNYEKEKELVDDLQKNMIYIRRQAYLGNGVPRLQQLNINDLEQ
uniref:Oxytocin-neurophysin 1 n=1 Tax=Lepeophtheirus salmonis TaxID=72036 RepID=D3PFK0_LEPSM|nr:Oxytocin-neurophysin 1 [Lepeophtheirus salmonis]